MTLASPGLTVHAAYKPGAVALFLATAAILGALAFEHLGGYLPCPLCLEERYAYYAGVPLLFLALILVSAEQRGAAAALFVIVALAFLANAALGTYHAGAEWHFWPGPQACSGAQQLNTSAGNMLDALQHTNVIRCDEAAGRFAGISFAGWNAIVSFLIVMMSLRAATEAVRTR